MDLLIESTDQVSASQQEIVIGNKKFVEFMLKPPIWDFGKISKNDYHTNLKEAKIDLIKKYYSHMLSSKFLLYIV